MAENTNLNVQFLRGESSALANVKNSSLGTFYLTTDTHELYIGTGDAPAPLNRWVDVVEKVEDIVASEAYKKPGKIYYATQENILCTWDANKNKWVQINVDTNDNTSTASISFAGSPVPVTDEDGKTTGYKYTLTLQQQDKSGNATNFEALTADFTITNNMVTSLVVDVAVGLEAAIETNKATIKTVGAGKDDSKAITLTGDGGITIGGTSSDITITGTTYELTSPKEGAAQIVLHSKIADTSVLLEGDTWIVPAANGEGKIKIEHAGPGKGEDISTTAGTDVSVDAKERKFTALTGIQKDTKGHIVGATATEFTIPNSNFELGVEEGEVSITNNATTEKANYTRQVELRDANNDNVISEVDIKTAHTITVDGTKKIIANGGDFGNFYSSTEIDRILRVANALTYKGTVDSQEDLPTTEVSLGDTYKVSTAFSNYEIGDLLIANGVGEDDYGYIYEGTLTWDHISTGEDTDTQYEIIGQDGLISLVVANGSNQGNVVSEIGISCPDLIDVTVGDNILTISHLSKDFEDENYKKSASAGEAVNVVTAIAKDDAGHIQGVTTTEITLPGADKVALAKDNFTITDASNNIKGNLNFANGNKTVVNTTVDETNKTLIVKFDHDTQDVTEATTGKDKSINLGASADEERTFDVLESVSYDDYGHITGYQSKKVTIGKQSSYNLTAPSVENNVVTQVMQQDGSNSVGTINLASDTLTYGVKTVGTTTLTQIDIVWGSF